MFVEKVETIEVKKNVWGDEPIQEGDIAFDTSKATAFYATGAFILVVFLILVSLI